MNHMDKLPDLAFVTNRMYVPGKTTNQSPVIGIKKGEMGFYPIWTTATATELNESHGVTPAQARAMHNGSMWGWETPSADPDGSINQSDEPV